MVDFPNSPVDGQVYTEEGSSWVWRDPPAVWQKLTAGGQETEIIESDDGASYQVWGDILIQWGRSVSSGGGNGVVTYPVAFKSGVVPRVATVVIDTVDADETMGTTISSTTNTGFAFNTKRIQGTAAPVGISRNVEWHAVGEAPDALKKSKVVSGAGPQKTIIAESDAASWQVWGDVLIQWGREAAGFPIGGTVTMPKSFKNTDFVVLGTGEQTVARIVTTGVDERTVNTFTAYRFQANGTNNNNGFSWIAIGEAPDDLKKPKSVEIGSDGSYQEFHDPTGAASWRIIGNTLECWGFATTGFGTASPVFGKTYANPPALTAVPSRNDYDPRIIQIAEVRTDGANINVMDETGASQNDPVYWHATGEWDGVS